MSEKYKPTSPSAISAKNQQKTISIKEKLHVISQLGKGKQIADVCHNISLTHSKYNL
jgi:hypothetical protein